MRNVVSVIAFTIFYILLASSVMAASCYTLDEAEAEQGIRIHSELMVIGLNCQHMVRGTNNQNLYREYRDFTAEHATLFADYERKLIEYYRRDGRANPISSLNTLRTSFANKVSNDAAQMRPDVFCSRYGNRIPTIASMDRHGLRKWASTFYDSHPVSQAICEQ